MAHRNGQRGDKTQSPATANGQDAVGLSITANSDANTVAVSDAVQAQLARLEDLLPDNTHTTIVEDQSVFTRASLDSIQRDLALAVIMVALVILLFLHDWKHTAIVLCAIPTSLISTFLVMYLLHFTLNTMSMMALALMIGILVDDSIVVLENIHRHLQLGENPIAAAINGRSEIGLAALAITACDVVVYTPVAFMSDFSGQQCRNDLRSDIVHATPMRLALVITEGCGRFRRLPRLATLGSQFAHERVLYSPPPILAGGRWRATAVPPWCTDSLRTRDGVRAPRQRRNSTSSYRPAWRPRPGRRQAKAMASDAGSPTTSRPYRPRQRRKRVLNSVRSASRRQEPAEARLSTAGCLRPTLQHCSASFNNGVNGLQDGGGGGGIAVTLGGGSNTSPKQQ